jgi:hypothetical protein
MLWLIPFLILCLFLLFRFVSPYEPVDWTGGERRGGKETGVGVTGGEERTGSPVEGFFAPVVLTVSEEFKKGYHTFREFHGAFVTRWKDALITAYQLEQPSLTGAKEPTPTELNATVTKITASLGKPLPPLPVENDPFPEVETLDDIERVRLLDRIPSSAQPYMDALEWMNQKFLQAEKELNHALQGGGIPSLEGFSLQGQGQGQGQECAAMTACLAENPDFLRQLSAAQQEEARQRLERIQRELLGRFAQFQQPRLQSAFELNGRLSAKAKETQRKAQSGEWIKDVRIPAKEEGPRPVAPPGGSALEELRQSDPERYAEYQRGYSSLFSVKQLMEQINRNLR